MLIEVKENDVLKTVVDENEKKRVKNQWFGLVRSSHQAYAGLNNEDLISKEESENRIILIEIALAILLSIPATVLTILICIEWSWTLPIIVTPNLSKPPEKLIKGFPAQHVALIYSDGSIYDISLTQNVSDNELLLKLPKDEHYFGYANGQGVLTFISATLSRPMTQFYDSKHNVIPNSGQKLKCPTNYFSKGIQVGNMFWVWGLVWRKEFEMNAQFNTVDTTTYIYYWKRNIWKKGPDLIPGASGPKTSTAINATSVIMIFDVDHSVGTQKFFRTHDVVATYIYNFARNHWTKFPSVKPISESMLAGDLALATLISKRSIKIYLHAVLVCWKLSGTRGTKWLLSYDLKDGSDGEWVIEYQHLTCFLNDQKGKA